MHFYRFYEENPTAATAAVDSNANGNNGINNGAAATGGIIRNKKPQELDLGNLITSPVSFGFFTTGIIETTSVP